VALGFAKAGCLVNLLVRFVGGKGIEISLPYPLNYWYRVRLSSRIPFLFHQLPLTGMETIFCNFLQLFWRKIFFINFPLRGWKIYKYVAIAFSNGDQGFC
ncbi:hypothetical protein, partial [Nostoc sp. KVJ20]|uniref:hypothetical protein n=1 Tax=Nostoc sp. KVJ20 TaxID=457944 RepID=UPI001C4050AE